MATRETSTRTRSVIWWGAAAVTLLAGYADLARRRRDRRRMAALVEADIAAERQMSDPLAALLATPGESSEPGHDGPAAPGAAPEGEE